MPVLPPDVRRPRAGGSGRRVSDARPDAGALKGGGYPRLIEVGPADDALSDRTIRAKTPAHAPRGLWGCNTS